MDVTVTEDALEVYADIRLIKSSASDSESSIVFDKRFSNVIVLVLRQFPLNQQIQEFGLNCVGNVSVECDYRTLFRSLGVMKLILNAMKTHKKSVQIMSKSVACIAHLIAGNYNENIKALINKELIELIDNLISSMRLHSHYIDCVRNGLGAIRNIAIDSELRTILGTAGACEIGHSKY